MLTPDQLQMVAALLAADSDMVAAYLFGSFAKGTESAASDLDVAVLLGAGVDRTEHSDRAIQLSLVLSKRLGREVDLVILNAAPPFLKFQIFRYGTPILEIGRASCRERVYVLV